MTTTQPRPNGGRSVWAILTAVSALLLLLFFGFKVIRFQALYYTYNDMYIFLQASSSWMDGRPLLYENIWGYDNRIHNNYAMLLWGPLIYSWGAYGAFLAQFLLFLTSYGLLFRQLSRQLPAWVSWTLLAVMLLGPVWFWFNEHPGIGWHPELMYLPLSILFLLALHGVHRNRRYTGWFLLTAALIVLVKEDGALLGGCLHLSYRCLQYLRSNPNKSVFGIVTTRQFWLIAVGWALVFCAGMLWLSYQNRSLEPEPRLQQALTAIAQGIRQKAFIRWNLTVLVHTILLLVPGFLLLVFFLWLTGFRQAGSLVLVFIVAQVLVLVSNWVQASTYYGTNPYYYLVSLTWPPRFVLMYALAVCYLVGMLLVFGPRLRPARGRVVAGVTGVLFLVQVPIVHLARPDFHFPTVLHDAFAYRYDPVKLPLLPESDVTVIRRLVAALPPRSNVYVFDYLIPFFHQHYNIWPTGNHWEEADLAIIPNDDFQKLTEKMPMKQPYRTVRLRTYTIHVTPAFEPYLNQSLRP
ncbi:hypothetical protein GCM10023189_33660 [Nibrella saemangeumensis]|uniref:4-amino-4-deoxy-L-arabinose transferase n=1 Tax=Nibrella saemangeumensis TaxID=1084526 RepID=A0ABP8N4C3_9BACT